MCPEKLFLCIQDFWRENLEIFTQSFPGNFLRQSFNESSFQISRQKLIREHLVQKIKMLNQLLGTWEES